EQQTATSEILGVIASSPTDIQPVLNTVAESAARLCEASDALIHRIDGDVVERVAVYGTMPVPETQRRPLSRGSPAGRAIIDRQTIHVHDVAAELTEFPDYKTRQPVTGVRTTLCTPLLRESVAIGGITVRRKEVRPFTEKQIELLKTFADQAVIAIENVRLFKALEERNRDLTEALEQQTATSEILRVISSSPTDLQPVFETILANATRLCGTRNAGLYRFDGELLHFAAGHNLPPDMIARQQSNPVRPGRESANRRAALERRTIHVPDVLVATNFHAYGTEVIRREGRRSTLAVPLLKEDTLLGVIVTSHYDEVRPFTDNQIKLVETFADQAVIAIENVRLFKELKESLEQQTATSEILGVIASSPTDLQPVLDAIAQSAARVCGSDDATIRLIEDDTLSLVAHYGTIPFALARLPLASRTPSNEAILQRKTVHISDVLTGAERFPDSGLVRDPRDPRGIRTYLVTPLLREGTPIGVIIIRRTEVKPFTDKQVALLETFASQAVIAIENVRLFKEIEERNAELR